MHHFVIKIGKVMRPPETITQGRGLGFLELSRLNNLLSDEKPKPDSGGSSCSEGDSGRFRLRSWAGFRTGELSLNSDFSG